MTYAEIQKLKWEQLSPERKRPMLFRLRNNEGQLFYMYFAFLGVNGTGEGSPARISIRMDNERVFGSEWDKGWDNGTSLFDGTIRSSQDLWDVMRFVEIVEYHAKQP